MSSSYVNTTRKIKTTLLVMFFFLTMTFDDNAWHPIEPVKFYDCTTQPGTSLSSSHRLPTVQARVNQKCYAPEKDWKPAISFRKLAIQIETLAFNINLENFFRETTLRTVRLFKANDQAVPIQDFNQLFNVFLTSLKTGRTQNSNENSMQLSRIFKQLQRNLIRPLGINGGCSRNS
ncbi:hypothetical protein B9Z55_027565 [Caenorhabditis nigoni]|nr:hypothetical protein B9Z55_027565 [Caenorhabditis nigoni]